MTTKIIKGAFDNQAEASASVRALQQANIDLGAVSVTTDIDEFRTVSTDLAGKTDMTVLICAFLMAVIGGVSGFALAMHNTVTVPGTSFLLLVPLMGAVCGIVVGSYLGMLIGVLLHFDRPTFSLPVHQGHLSRGTVMVSVRVQDSYDRQRAEAIMEEHGAFEIVSQSVESESMAKT